MKKAPAPTKTQGAFDATNDTAIFAPAQPADKPFATLQAEFALRGHSLTRSRRADDGRTSYSVSRWGQSRCFTSWHDVCAFLAQIGGRQ